MAPSWAQRPLLVLATVATIIASQAAISGSFSVAKQAMQLGFLPRLKVLHTSDDGGADLRPVRQLGPVRRRRRAHPGLPQRDKLGDIYGVAVTGTFVLNTILFVARRPALWNTPSGGCAPRRRCS